MHGFRSTHSVLVRSLAELDARDPLLIETSLPADSNPIVGQLVSPLVGDEPNGSKQPPTPPGNSPSNSSPPGNSPPGAPPPDTTSIGGNKSMNANGGGTSSPTPTSGAELGFQPIASSNTTPTSNPVRTPSSSPSAHNGNGGSSSTSSLGATGSGSPSVSSGQAASASVMSGAPSGSLPTSLGPLATNYLDAPQSSLGSSSHTVGVLAPSSTTAEAISVGEQLSGGTIAGIIIVCLFLFLTLILLAFRRRSIARRAELRNQWWLNRNRGGRSFSAIGRPRSAINTNGEVPASRPSARSSFATTFDQGLIFRVDSPSRFSVGVVPEYPPMAEVRERNSFLISTGATVARRTSMKSMLTHGNDPDTQYFTVSTGQDNLEPFTPMSVRPFSPSESFFFPKPPMRSSTDSFFFLDGQGHTSSISSAATLVQVATPHPALLIDHPTANPQSLAPGAALSPLTAAANTSPNPFADPVKPDVEVIRRPFAPSLDDELMVYPGDHVRIFQIFDDGWAFVERLVSTEGKRHDRGLIPLDCLREANQPLPTLLAQKRISCGSHQPIGYAL